MRQILDRIRAEAHLDDGHKQRNGQRPSRDTRMRRDRKASGEFRQRTRRGQVFQIPA